jgi:predicted transcriptional regulator
MDATLLDDLDEPVGSDLLATPEPVPMTIKEKWQGAVTSSSGFVAIPVALLRLQTHLKLSATDMVVLANFLAHWWDPDRSVYPRSSTIAQRMGVTKRTVQRSTNKMLKRGLIERRFGDDGRRSFQFRPLAERLSRMIGASLAQKEVLDT